MYIVVGGNGYLGNYIIEGILEKTNEKIIATARNVSDACINDIFFNNDRISWEKFDLLDEKRTDEFLDKINPIENKKIVFLSAYHNPDLVEKNEKYAWNVNVTRLSYFINRLENVSKFFYPSTDSVYGNSLDGYHFKENDTLNPVNTYGKQKTVAEKLVMTKGFNVVRFPFLIAPSLVKAKKHFYDKIVDDLKNGKAVEMFSDSYRSSLNFKTAGELLVDLIENKNEIPSIVNVSSDYDLSKYDIGLMIAKKIGVDESLVKAISCNELNGIFDAKRATSTLLDNSLLKSILKLDKVEFVI